MPFDPLVRQGHNFWLVQFGMAHQPSTSEFTSTSSKPAIIKRQSARRDRGKDYIPSLVYSKFGQSKEYKKQWAAKLKKEKLKKDIMARTKRHVKETTSTSSSSPPIRKRKSPTNLQQKTRNSAKRKKNSKDLRSEKQLRRTKKSDDSEDHEENVSDDDDSTANESDETNDNSSVIDEKDDEDDDEVDDVEENNQDELVSKIKNSSNKKEVNNKYSGTKKVKNTETIKNNNIDNEHSEEEGGNESDNSRKSDENDVMQSDNEKQNDSKNFNFYRKLERSEKYGSLTVAELARLSGHVRHNLFRKCKFVDESMVNKFVDEFCSNNEIVNPNEVESKRKNMCKLIKDTFNARRGYATQQIVEKMRGMCKR